MSEENTKTKRQRIQRLIRDLNIRFIRGSIDRRTYQTLKNKYQQIVESLPPLFDFDKNNEVKSQQIESISQAESDIKRFQSEIDEPTKEEPILDIEIPEITLSEIPKVEIEDLKIRYIMHLAMKASAKTFVEEIEYEKEYLSGKLSNEEYLEAKNAIETKQHKIFSHFYKLSDILFNVSKEHLFKRTHNNFLLFTNELSENLNRLRTKEVDRYEVKGIIYDINDTVLRHRPILQKALQDTTKWKEYVIDEIERFKDFKKQYINQISSLKREEIERTTKQLEIYNLLLEEDLKDYGTDIEAIDEIYGEHLRYQEIVSPYFEELEEDILINIKCYNENIRSIHFREKLSISSSTTTRNIDYQMLAELNTLWNLVGRPVVNEERNLVGFLVGPGKIDDDYGAIIWQQREISVEMARRIYDHVVAPIRFGREGGSDDDKKRELMNEIPTTLPYISFNYLTPEVVTKYCAKIEADISKDLLTFMKQPLNHLFAPLAQISKESREIVLKTENVKHNGSMLPNYDLTKSNNINRILSEYEDVQIKDLYGERIGYAHSVISHPRKGHFLIVKKEKLPEELYATIYDMIVERSCEDDSDAEIMANEEKRWRLLLKLSREYERTEVDVGEPDFLKEILVAKNTGILPNNIENSVYEIYSIGSIRIIGNSFQIAYAAPSFEIANIFDLEGKIVENVKGTEIGVVYTIQIRNQPILIVWSRIDLLLIASFISNDPMSLLKKDAHFTDNLAIAIGKHLSIAPQIALRPDNVITFMNLIGKISSLKEIEEIMAKFEPTKIELSRIISIDEQKILVDITDEELSVGRREESRESRERDHFVASPDYYLQNTSEENE